MGSFKTGTRHKNVAYVIKMRLYSWERYEPLNITKTGIAIAKFFGEGATIGTGRDGHAVSRFARRCIVSGLVARGAQVLDFRLVPSQALRYGTVNQHLDGSVYVSFYRDEVQIHVYGKDGRNMHAEGLLRIRELVQDTADESCSRNDIGSLMQYTNGIEDYVDHLLPIMKRKMAKKVLVDTQADPISLVVEPILQKAGVEYRIFNPMLMDSGGLRSREEFMEELKLGRYDAGVIIERDELLGIALIDSEGRKVQFGSLEEMLKGLSGRSDDV